jgi:predicted N-acyltransferase
MPTLTLSLHDSIHDIPSAEWGACAGVDNPFVSHGFLSALEDSGSAAARTGWLPRHMVWRDETGTVQAAAPSYLKSHSYGEYVFDHAWADALHQAGGRYYPKLQTAVPFSPVPGPRLLRRSHSTVKAADMGAGLAAICRQLDLSSAHVTFCTEAEQQALQAAGWLPRLGTQYHWLNHDYADFEDFLAALSSRKRKNIRKERQQAQGELEFLTLTGPEIEPRHWQAFYEFYTATVDRKWGSAYLTPQFFPLLAERLGDKVVLMLALQHGEPVAGALNLRGSEALYGRNWGCKGEWPFLHFELCYYRAIDYAIAHGLTRVEAGAQGEHKIQRGYLPQPTYSAHWIEHPGLRRAISDFLDREWPALQRERAALMDLSPYKADTPDG